MRTLFLGTTELAAAVLERLVASPHRPSLVVTRPDRPRGRGQRVQSPPVADAARTLGLEVFQPEDVNAEAAIARISAARPELLCMCAYGALLGDELLSRWEILNVHPSLLPRWRGAAPLERAIEAGDPLTGVSIMLTERELDAGPLLLQRSEPILPDDDWGSLSARIARLAGELLVDALDLRPPPRPQPSYGITYASRVEKHERVLDPALGCERLARRVRALNPHIGCHLQIPGGGDLKVRAARAHPGSSAVDARPGELVACRGRLFLVAVDGLLELLRVQPAGGRAMGAAEFLRGHGRSVRRVEAAVC